MDPSDAERIGDEATVVGYAIDEEVAPREHSFSTAGSDPKRRRRERDVLTAELEG